MGGARVFEHSVRVPYAHVDKMGFVYYANYLVYFEMARAEMLRQAGVPYPALEEKGVFLPVVESFCEYLRPANYDDLLVTRLQCSRRGARLHIEYDMCRTVSGTRGGLSEPEPVARGYTDHVCMSRDGRVLKPVPELRVLTE